MKIAILGANGMIGSAITYVLSQEKKFKIFALIRKRSFFYDQFNIKTWEYDRLNKFKSFLNEIKPNVVINCAGITKHVEKNNKIYDTIYVNSIFPHELSCYCYSKNIKLIHISSDCVFSGKKGDYLENDLADAMDLYGKTKSISELIFKNSLVLRTSTIGHEIYTKHGLLEWFLSQKECKGYDKAIFSGLTNIEFAKVIRFYLIKKPLISGLYNVGGIKISKYSLLNIISNVYKKNIYIEKDIKFKINRSLNSSAFYFETGYKPITWEHMIKEMYSQKFIWEKNNV